MPSATTLSLIQRVAPKQLRRQPPPNTIAVVGDLLVNFAAAISAACAVLMYRLQRAKHLEEARPESAPLRFRASRAIVALGGSRGVATGDHSSRADPCWPALFGALDGRQPAQMTVALALAAIIAAAVTISGATARKRAELNAVGLMLAVAAGALIMPAFADPHPARSAASPLLRVSHESSSAPISQEQDAETVHAVPGENLLVNVKLTPASREALTDVRLRVRFDGSRIHVRAQAENAPDLQRSILVLSLAGPGAQLSPMSAVVTIGKTTSQPANLFRETLRYARIGRGDASAVDLRFSLHLPRPCAAGRFSCSASCAGV